MSAGKHREIWHEHRFERELARIEPNTRRADEFLEGAIEILATNPFYGTQLDPGSAVWFLPIADIPSLPKLWLYYSFDDDNVILLSIEKA